jgi:hypothetical protein
MTQPGEQTRVLSGREQGEVNLAKLRDYLDGLAAANEELPMDGERPNISAISKASGVPRSAFYTNGGIKKLLADFLGVAPGESPAGDDQFARHQEQVELRDRRILQLEQRLAAVQAENQGLRGQVVELKKSLRRYQIIEDEVVTAGRRIIP